MQLEEAGEVAVLFHVAVIVIGVDLFGGEAEVCLEVVEEVGQAVEEEASEVLGAEVLVVADQAVVGKNFNCDNKKEIDHSISFLFRKTFLKSRLHY